jgi:hypothetical protein
VIILKIINHGKYYSKPIPKLEEKIEVACPECGRELLVHRKFKSDHTIMCKPMLTAYYEEECPDCHCKFSDKESIITGKIVWKALINRISVFLAVANLAIFIISAIVCEGLQKLNENTDVYIVILVISFILMIVSGFTASFTSEDSYDY